MIAKLEPTGNTTLAKGVTQIFYKPADQANPCCFPDRPSKHTRQDPNRIAADAYGARLLSSDLHQNFLPRRGRVMYVNINT